MRGGDTDDRVAFIDDCIDGILEVVLDDTVGGGVGRPMRDGLPDELGRLGDPGAGPGHGYRVRLWLPAGGSVLRQGGGMWGRQAWASMQGRVSGS